MKIFDLLEGPIHPTQKTRQLSRDLRSKQLKISSTTPSGAFSHVRRDNDPHMIKKTSNRAESGTFTEGFKAFITFLINNNYMDNPHLPRVYDITTLRGTDGYYIDTFKIEKLINGANIDTDEMHRYFTMVTGQEEVDWKPHIDLAEFISEEIKSGGRVFRLESLNEACEIVRKAIRATGGTEDVHYNNIMFRRTPHGIQVVINDPIFIPRSKDTL